MKPKKKNNTLCDRCFGKCKQNKEMILITCPKYKPKPKQLVFDFKEK